MGRMLSRVSVPRRTPHTGRVDRQREDTVTPNTDRGRGWRRCGAGRPGLGYEGGVALIWAVNLTLWAPEAPDTHQTVAPA